MTDVTVVVEAAPVVVRIVVAGPQGPQGIPGGTSYTHTQGSAAATWTINHNLGFRPVITLLSVGGVEIVGEVAHVSLNQAVAQFSAPVAGSARCI